MWGWRNTPALCYAGLSVKLCFELKHEPMEVVTFESTAFEKLVADIKTIANYIQEQKNNQAKSACDDEMWVDNYDVCTFLRISERTLQRLRKSKKITYSRIERHIYYQIKEIRRMLENHLIRSNEEYLQNLIDNQKLYVEQRRIAKSHK